MGHLISKVLASLSGGSRPIRIVMLGLDAAGKTTILQKLRLNENMHSVPTIGFNVEDVKYKNLNLTICDMGGQNRIRELWQYLQEGSHAIIQVLDSCDEDRFEEAKETMHQVLKNEQLRDVPLLVWANKQDAARCSLGQITEKLGLSEVKNRDWQIQGSCALTGDGLSEGLDWLNQKLNNRKK